MCYSTTRSHPQNDLPGLWVGRMDAEQSLFTLSILGGYGIKKKNKIAQLQHFVHPCNRVEKMMNGCWKHILPSFWLETVGWTVKSCVELRTAG